MQRLAVHTTEIKLQ